MKISKLIKKTAAKNGNGIFNGFQRQTSIFHDLTLLTRNIDDFKNIEGLSFLNPWEE
jgi:predicted nucleic acid-binding protein